FIPDNLNDTTASVTAFTSDKFGGYDMLVIVAMLSFCMLLMFSRFGEIRLGNDDDAPESSLPAWFAMLFSAGMGIGLMIFTTAETISHAFANAPNAEPGSDQAIEESLQYAAFHWGFHGWGLYAIVALVLAYFQFHKEAPGLVSSTLIPIFGDKAM